MNKNKLNDLLGINETKIAVLDILINLAKEQEGIITLENLEKIKEGFVDHITRQAVIDELR